MYEQTIGAVTMFFGLLVGLGLKQLFDKQRLGTIETWLCFVCGVFLFLRFVIGSANHLHLVYVKPHSEPVKGLSVEGWFFFDALMLVGFGLAALYAGQAHTVISFLRRLTLFLCLALIWSFCDLFRHAEWKFWLWINGLQLLAVLFAWQMYDPRPTLVSSTRWRNYPHRLGRWLSQTLFTIPKECRTTLDEGKASLPLLSAFQENKTALSECVSVSVEEKGTEWRITDKFHRRKFALVEEGEKITVYEFRKSLRFAGIPGLIWPLVFLVVVSLFLLMWDIDYQFAWIAEKS